MHFIPFYVRYKDLAAKETRTITLPASYSGLPAGEYGLLENYCTDDSCDCRKVMINVVNAKSPREFLATIGYGWESAEFYTEWIGGDKALGKMMVGAYLEPGGIQTKHAQQFLELFKAVALTDDYVEQLKKHYRMFKRYGVKTVEREKRGKRVVKRGVNW